MLTRDSVFDRFLLSPFEDDAPEIPIGRIQIDIGRLEQAFETLQADSIGDAADDLLRRAEPFRRTGDVAAIANLQSALNIAIQRHIFNAWEDTFELGGTHGIQEMTSVTGFDLNLSPVPLVNSPAREAVMNRAIQIAGSFSTEAINRLKADLIASMVPDGDGQIISRRELRNRIQNTLNITESRANTIARTETTNAYNTGRVSTYKQSQLVTHVRFLAITDNRVSDICASRNGLVIPIDDADELRPPLHPNCRSILTALLPSVSDRHAEMLQDERRKLRNRVLAPLPNGWR